MTTKIYFDGQMENGAFIKNASVILNEDYTMNQLVTAIRNRGFVSFMTITMRTLVAIK